MRNTRLGGKVTIKNILLAHTGTVAYPSSLRYAVKIAAKHNAWLTGIYGSSTSYFDQVLGLSDDLLAKVLEIKNSKIDGVRDLFQEEVVRGGIRERAEFLALDALGELSPAEVARNFDFIVTGYQSKLPNDEYRGASPDLMALRSGRPVLVVPDGYEAETLATHALVAWDGKRSAARAVNDAMSVLEEKPRKVSLLTVGKVADDLSSPTGILTHLERHGIQADHIQRSKSRHNIAEIIKTTADEVGAKLIVMGAFEHSKFSQDVFGGVTHDVMQTAQVPVFMSH